MSVGILSGVRPSPRVLDGVGTVVRLGLAAVWLVAGIPKLLDLHQNYIAVQAYDLLPSGVVNVVASGQPFLEVALGLLLLIGIGTRLVGVLSVLLFCVYIAGIISVWVRGIAIDCGCFSSGGAVALSDTHYGWDIARDVGFVLLGAWLVWRPHTFASLDSLLFGVEPPDGDGDNTTQSKSNQVDSVA